MYKIVVIAFCVLMSLPAQAQNDTMPDMLKFKVDKMYELLEEDILNVNVTIASKKSEKLFDAPLSTSVITKDDIRKAGSTCIMEALRLIPGLVVLEQSNGNYDIHLRGGSNVQRNSLFSVAGNTTTLVMIDDRPTYNYYLGGTFWETLPIDLNDVERIELVRGPTSAMYGPNAVAGVINIITRKAEQRGWYAVGNAQQGANQTIINNGSLGYRFNDKFSMILSANAQRRNRTQETYYNYAKNQYVPVDTILKNYALGNAYPSAEQAMQKYGYNAFLHYKPNEKFNMRVSLGEQDSRVQKAYSENFATPLTTSTSRSRYIDVVGHYQRLTAQFSYQAGTQEEGLGTLGQKWDFKTIDGLLEYEFRIKDATLELGANFRQGIYDDRRYVNVAIKEGQFNGSRGIRTFAPFVRFDYGGLLNGGLRLTSAIRLDMFNHPDKPYLSYHVSANYKPNDKHLFRAVYARANRSANIIFTYADRFLEVATDPGTGTITAIEVAGNQQLDLHTMDMIELGYRSILDDNLQASVELFYNNTRNYANFLYGDAYTAQRNGKNYLIQPFATYNIPLATRQFGATVSVNWVVGKLHVRPYLTYQQMQLQNSSPYNNTEKAIFANEPAKNNINSFLGQKEKDNGMPAWFGGLVANWDIIPRKLHLNLNSYFFTNYTYYTYQNPTFPDGRGRATIAGKPIINTKFSFQIVPNTNIFLGLRNALNRTTFEFYNTDATGISIFGGLHFEL
ncbi:MAG: hypothetical protein EAZ95_12795 [Bacteroidetes bacterium]|nr:MAG: hypothetical protein EAZ95_12795 [Bacteroidota bacterium]